MGNSLEEKIRGVYQKAITLIPDEHKGFIETTMDGFRLTMRLKFGFKSDKKGLAWAEEFLTENTFSAIKNLTYEQKKFIAEKFLEVAEKILIEAENEKISAEESLLNLGEKLLEGEEENVSDFSIG